MDSKKSKIEITKDNRKKADIIIKKGGFLEFNRNMVIRMDDEEFDNPCKASQILMVKLKRDNNVDM